MFILAKYYTAAHGPATSLLQFELQLLYIGCGLGKMGPWFAAVFNQEWTLPPWCAAHSASLGPSSPAFAR